MNQLPPTRRKEKKKREERRKQVQHIEYELEEEQQNLFNSQGKMKLFVHILPSVVYFEKIKSSTAVTY